MPFWTNTDALTPIEFRMLFRMYRCDFRRLGNTVRPKLVRNEAVSASRNGVIEPEVKIAVVLRMLAERFSSSRHGANPLPGYISALDGIAIRIRKPRTSDCTNPASYYHRKRYYAITVQDICDSDYRFMFMSAKCAGPTHD
eukprot:IDg5988t1